MFLKQLLRGTVTESLAWCSIDLIGKHEDLLLSVIMNGTSFGDESVQNAVGSLIDRLLPDRIEVGKIDLSAKGFKMENAANSFPLSVVTINAKSKHKTAGNRLKTTSADGCLIQNIFF